MFVAYLVRTCYVTSYVTAPDYAFHPTPKPDFLQEKSPAVKAGA